MEQIKLILVHIAEWIEILGIIILIYGFAKFFIQYLIEEFIKNGLNPPISILQKIRCKIGVYILLSLEVTFLIGGILSVYTGSICGDHQGLEGTLATVMLGLHQVTYGIIELLLFF